MGFTDSEEAAAEIESKKTEMTLTGASHLASVLPADL